MKKKIPVQSTSMYRPRSSVLNTHRTSRRYTPARIAPCMSALRTVGGRRPLSGSFPVFRAARLASFLAMILHILDDLAVSRIFPTHPSCKGTCYLVVYGAQMRRQFLSGDLLFSLPTHQDHRIPEPYRRVTLHLHHALVHAHVPHPRLPAALDQDISPICQSPRETVTISNRHQRHPSTVPSFPCLLYTSDAADDLLCVDLGGRRIIKK